MKTSAARPAIPRLTDHEIDELMAHPYWEKLEDGLDALIRLIPQTSETFERTTVLTWIYRQQGVMTFLELADRLTGIENISARKRHLRAALRNLKRLLLVNIVNFPDDAGSLEDIDEDEIGSGSLISLTWTGMVWMRRAWQARARLAVPASIVRVHRMLVAEEDDGKANEPYWVENISGADPEGPARRARRIVDIVPAVSSIFHLAHSKRGRRQGAT
jgi:hypothetical protein